MKVLLFTSEFYEYIVPLANALAEREQVILMVAGNTIDSKYYDLISPKIKLEKFNWIDYSSIRQNAGMIRQIVKTINSHHPDILHIQANGHPWFMVAMFFLKKMKLINTIHDPVVHQGDRVSRGGYWRRFFGRRFSDRFIVHGEFLKEELQKSYQVPATRIDVIPLGHFGIISHWRKEKVEEEPF